MQHLKSDLGILKKGSTVVVTLDKQANVLLMDSSNYQSYSSGRGGRWQFFGGLAKKSPARIPVPSTGRWILAVDLGGHAGRVRTSVAVVPPPRGDLPEYREPSERSLAGAVATRIPLPPESSEELDGRMWDVFLSHASEDKAAVAIPLAQALQDRGITVWLDQTELRIGDSLRRRIDRGLRSSRFAAVIFSEPYLAKGWPQYELDGIVTLSVDGTQSLLPIWHGVSRDQVMAHSASLADKLARNTSDMPLDEIAAEIAELVMETRG